ncbi:hypothetical protein LZ318_31900 [Saccharopolyspora indica]|uniref:hypothetical protein n=1 Tax=Saccharopolyspora indica TaxID=1229659 RepID=UPI0022EAE597|nr:hypothetical protein [Saccharopolyspora indica]MDA3644158.1 hypothetical protein [Saccharopolyspora indica]
MAAAMRVATFPFRALFRLIKFLLVPTAFGALSVWLYTALEAPWLLVLIVLCAVWALVMLRLWQVQVAGELRSLARGTVHVAGSHRRRPRRGDRL